MKPTSFLAAVAALALFAVGCSSTQSGTDPGVDAQSDVTMDAETSCGADLILCDDRCVAAQTDRANCGACGHACSAGEVCVAGACAVSCPGSQIACAGACVDPASDRAHCGAAGDCAGANAGSVCADGEVCVAGSCRVSCPAGQVNCGGRCVDPASDPAHCGAAADCKGGNAGVACAAGEVCAAGGCQISCPAGQVNCGGRCIDPATDPLHCGAADACTGASAGTACAAGQVCSAGVCRTSCPGGQVNCDGRCVDPASDRAHCGAAADCKDDNAGVACAAGEVCAAGSCQVSCPVGQVNCGGRCVDPATDRAFCGASGSCTGVSAGTACFAGQVCVDGACVASCGTGLQVCGTSCVNTASDPLHCSGCGITCPARANAAPVCVASACNFVCKAGFGDCNGVAGDGCELDTTRDNDHCGACGNRCGSGSICIGGTCRAARVLVYNDSGGTLADDAAVAMGGIPVLTTNGAGFAAEFDAGNVSAIIIDAPANGLPSELESRLSSWVAGGGRLIFGWWSLHLSPSLQSTLGVTAGDGYDGYRPVHRDPTSAVNLFAGSRSVPSPLTGSDRASINGQPLTLSGAGTIAARLDSPTGQGAIAVTHGNRVIVHGFLPWDVIGVDADSDGIPDMQELYENELALVLAN